MNPALTASNYSPFSVTAPVDTRLPGGGGNAICCFADLNPEYLQFVKQTIAFSKNYGNISDVYTGFDVSISARLKEIIIQGGISTGHEVVDVCDIVGKVNDIAMTAGGIYGPPGGPVL